MPPLRFFVHVIASVAEASGRVLIGRRRRRAWPFLFEVVVGVLRRNFLHSARLPVAEARAFNEAVAAAQPKRHHVSVTYETLAGVRVARFVPKGPPPSRLLVYLHGGSYVMGSPRTHEDLIARIAEEGLVVIAPDYRLAPEHTIADACADACAVIEAAIAEGWPASSIVLGGDSAGGGLAYLVGIALRDSGRSLPAAIATIAPWVDLTCTGASFEDNEHFDWGTGEALRAQAHLAAGRSRLDDPTISPAFADLRGLPPSLIHVGEAEIVRDPVTAFASKLREAGVSTELVAWPDMVHDFHFLAEQHPVAHEATRALGQWIVSRSRTRA